MLERKKVLRKVLKSLNGSLDVISKLERDVPITIIASMEMNNVFRDVGIEDVGIETLRVAGKLNNYKRNYWKLEISIKEYFMGILGKEGYLPGRSIEVESLANVLPGSMIKGDERIWIYSYDHYISKIAERVGRDPRGAPTGRDIWDRILRRFDKRIKELVNEANSIIPDVFYLKARLTALIGKDDARFNDIKVRKPKVTLIERPIRKVMIVKRPIPIQSTFKKPKKRVLRKPKFEVIGPEDIR